MVKFIGLEKKEVKTMNKVNPLAYQRKLNGLSQRELAEFSWVSVRLIQDYEQGRRDINKAAGETLYKLAACGCAMEDLLNIVVE